MGFLKVSSNGRYFTRDGKPFFWLGDTIWPVCSMYSVDELDEYFGRRAKQGFTVEHIGLPWDGFIDLHHTDATEDGESLWLNNNPATPNEKFFKKVDAVLAVAKKHGLIVSILPCGGSIGSYVHRKKIITKDNARAYGKWLGQRYKDEPDIVWGNGFDLHPWLYDDIAQEISAGLREGDGGNHLIFYHPCGGTSSSYFHDEDWLAGNFIQTWADYENIHSMVIADFHRKPHKPVVMVEGAYEAGVEYPTAPITAGLVRRQAYTSYLSGATGHSYGHNDVWRKTPYWRDALDALGGNQLTILKDFFTSLEWWKLEPRQLMFAEEVPPTKHIAACSSDGNFAVVYFYCRTTLSIDLGAVGTKKPLEAVWVDPQTGKRQAIGVFSDMGIQQFTSPAWCEDALLLLTEK